MLNSVHLGALSILAFTSTANSGMFDLGDIQKMAAGYGLKLPDINDLTNMAKTMGVQPMVDSVVGKMDFLNIDPTAYITKQVEGALGLQIPPGAGPEVKEQLILQMLIKASAQIPLELLDPLEPYNKQIDAALAIAKQVAANFNEAAAKPIFEKVAEMKLKCKNALSTQFIFLVKKMVETTMANTAMASPTFLSLVDEALTMVLINKEAKPVERMGLLVKGFIAFKVPAIEGQKNYHAGLITCFDGKLRGIFQTMTDNKDEVGANAAVTKETFAIIKELKVLFPQPEVTGKETTPKPELP